MPFLNPLIQVLCARPPVDTSVEEDQMGLALWVQNCIKKGTLDQIIDPSIRGQISPNCLKVFAEVANKCLHNYPKGRPTMSKVVGSLKHGLASQGNIRISRKKEILSNLFLSTAHVVANGIDLGWRKWKNWGPKNGVSGQLWRDLVENCVIQSFRCFFLTEIRALTNNFHELLVIGQVVETKVYRGHINRGNLEVAIEKWKEGTSRESNLDQFRAQIQVHFHLRHLHIVSLIGYCIDKHELILVYEYMVHGYLNETNECSLNWEKRLEICIGVARGLQYLRVRGNQSFIGTQIPPILCWMRIGMRKYYITLYQVYAPWDMMIQNTLSMQNLLQNLMCTHSASSYLNYCMIIDPYLTDKISPECLKEYVKNAKNCVCDEGIERPSMDDVLGNLRYALQLRKTWWNSNDQFSTVKSPEVVPSSDGTVIVELARRGDIDEMSFTSPGDSDYFSGNLAR
ncbi:hypothetical protein ACSBR2_040094 [Camellia fascicularis]